MLRLELEKKTTGLLLLVFALRRAGDRGIGDPVAMWAVDFYAEHGFAVRQLPPIHETVGNHSPFNSISARALSPALVMHSHEEVPGLPAEEWAEAAPEAWLLQRRTGLVKQNWAQPLTLQILHNAHRGFRARTAEDADLAAEFTAFEDAQEGMQLIAEIMGAMPGYIRVALDDLKVAGLTFPQWERAADRTLQTIESVVTAARRTGSLS